MKVVNLITTSEPIGGAQVHVRDLSRALVELGHDVTVLTGNKGLFTDQLKALGIRCEILPNLVRPIGLKDLRALSEIKSALKSIKPDLLTTHSSKAGWLGRIAGHSIGIPTVFTAHGWAFAEGVPGIKRRFYLVAEKLVAPLAARIITVSDYDRTLALQHGVGKPHKIVTIHNGVQERVEALADPGRQPPRMIMVARFQAQKDHATLLKALADIKQLNWTIDLVGDGPLRPEVEDFIAENGLTGRVRLLGERKDVLDLLGQSQLFLLISNWEGFPLSILEGMQAGLPVIASNVGGVKEAVEDGINGFLIDRGDQASLARRLFELLGNPELREQMGVAGRKKYEDNFTVRHMVQKILALYQEILNT